jgi:hypothetical protein
MTAHSLYLAKSAKIATLTLKGFVSVQIDQNATAVSPRGDGKLYAEKTCITGVEETLTIEVEDIGVAPEIGLTGALEVKGAQLAGGADFGASDLVIATKAGPPAASVTVLNVGRTKDAEGRPRLRISLKANSGDGLTSALSFTVP